jgi:hypothetical protein
MVQPYDLKDLENRLVSKGLVVAEGAAKAVTNEVFAWVTESIKLSATPLDDIALIVLDQLKQKLLALEDKIDGVTGN